MTSPLLPHARALLASPSTLTVAELDEALGVAQSVHSLRLTAAVAMARDAMPLLASLCTALEASEAEAGRLRAELAEARAVTGITAWAGDVRLAAKFAAHRDRLRAALDQLRRDVDGYDMAFDYAEFIAAGKPGGEGVEAFEAFITTRTEDTGGIK